MSEAHRNSGRLPLEIVRRVDALCDEYEEKLLSGERPSFESVLARVPSVARQRLLRELIEVANEVGYAEDEAKFEDKLKQENPGIAEELSRAFAERMPTAPFNQSPTPTHDVLLRTGMQFGDYRIIRQLGNGGMGAVYEAEQLPSGRRVALKVIKDSNPTPALRRRFLKEGRLAAAINHPNSVYIFGTEEIGEQLAIVMELAAGGTLADAVSQEGGLPPNKAVDCTLDIVAGLTAAQEKGIIHRDIKPSNCFVGLDGSVRIGDFGLSVSSVVDVNTLLTRSGAPPIGTPQFAPPEQLRGGDLDLRSDIYSVGATLYYLLSGRPPFSGKQIMSLIAKVLEEAPVPLQELCPQAPPHLCRVVMRCLEKQPENRYQSYEELRQSLLPFSGQATQPAKLIARLVAYVIDFMAIEISLSLVLLPWFVQWTNLSVDGKSWELAEDIFSGDSEGSVWKQLQFFASYLPEAIYFAVCEARWGATFGKWLLKIQVTTTKRVAPSILTAFLRSLILICIVESSELTAVALSHLGYPHFASELREGGNLAYACYLVPIAAFFLTARKANGWQGLHEYLTGTKTSRELVDREDAIALSGECAADATPTSSDKIVGPYQTTGIRNCVGGAEVLEATDRALDRSVWIVERSVDFPYPTTSRRDLARGGRLRWLSGARSQEGAWDAYEATPGCTWRQLSQVARDWETTRYLLHALCVELEQAINTDTLPSRLTLDDIWVDRRGRVILLDLDGTVAVASGTREEQLASARYLLQVAADAILTGKTLSLGERSAKLPQDLPMHARAIIDGLDVSSETALPVRELKDSLHRPSRITLRGRVRVLALCSLMLFAPLLIRSLQDVDEPDEVERLLTQVPQIGQVVGLIDYYQTLERREDDSSQDYTSEKNAIARTLHRQEYNRELINERLQREPGYSWLIEPQDQATYDKILDGDPPDMTEQQYAESSSAIASGVSSRAWTAERYRDYMHDDQEELVSFLGRLGFGLVFLAGLPSMLGALFFGRSPLLSVLGVSIVSSTGERASRLRAFARSVLLWMVLIGSLLVVGGVPKLDLNGLMSELPYATLIVSALLYAAFFVVTFLSRRGWHDRISGTRLVVE